MSACQTAGELLRNRTPFVGTIAYMGGVHSILSEWVWSWTQMLVFNGEHFGPGGIHYDKASSSYHASARNEVSRRMKGDWLLQLDTDHQFEPDLAWRLVDTFNKHNLDVLCGFYQYRTFPHMPTIYRYLEDQLTPDGDPISRPIIGWTGDSPVIQISAAGGGCLLVRRRVFDRIRRELHCEPFDVKHPWSEDHSFFQRLFRLGISVYCDTGVQYSHLTTRKVTPKDFVREALAGNPVEHEFQPL